MARQLSALPRIPKQYELYRSRKFLASESFLHVNVGSKCLNGRKDPEVNTCADKEEEEKSTPERPVLKCFEDKDESNEVVDSNSHHNCHESRKKRKGKKVKAGNSDVICQPVTLDNLKEKQCDEEIENEAIGKSCELVDKSPCESDYYSAEGGCLPSPAISDSPPFGFPLSPERLFESAISLLSKHDATEEMSSTCVATASSPIHKPEPSANISNLECRDFDLASTISNNAQGNLKKVSSKNDTETKVIVNKGKSNVQFDEQEKRQKVDFDGSVENAKSDLESEVVKIDISTLEFDEQGWQSQTKRHRKKKKESILKIASNRDKHNSYLNNKFLKKTGSFNNPGQHNIKRGHNDNYKKKWGNKQYRTNRAASNCKDIEEKCHRWMNGEKPDTGSSCMEELAVATEAISEERKKLVPSENQDSRPKLLSYRDALLKSKSKEDLHYSSDSGVDASSVSSSCDSVIPQPELPCYHPQDAGVVSQCCSVGASAKRESDTSFYNHTEVAKYLWETWTVVQEKYKKGLVVRYNDRKELTGLQHHAKFKSPGSGQRYRKGKVN